MKNHSNVNKNLGWLLNNCEPEDFPLVKKLFEDECILVCMKYSSHTGKTNPSLQEFLIREFEVLEGNQGH
tara:strand:- start:1199 stop:1408 length:210 start_codon:yes stop_codon:yes gene_type:complete